MFNPKAYENSRPDGFGVLEVVAAEEQAPRQFVALRRSELRGELAGPLAALRLLQTFGYTSAECDRTLEAVYRFPLPGDAAVTGVRVQFGEVEIRASLQERQQAEERYAEARQQGQQAALLTRESPDVFTLQLAGIQPDQEILVETSYVQLARMEGAGWSLRIPLTTAPRYVRSDELSSRHAQGQPLALLRDPGHRFALDLTLHAAAAVRSPTHSLAVERGRERLRVRLEQGEVLPDRDCVLAWQPAQEQRPQLQLLLHDDAERGQLYFLALISPPALLERGGGVPREVVLLVDHSGSMSGAKWEAADWAVKQYLAGLNEAEAFHLALFHSTTRWYAKEPRQASPAAVREAISFLMAHRDSGGTELGVALEQALTQKRAPGEHARHVLVITDAAVSDAARIMRLADQEARQRERRRISVLCIDAAPNAFLAHELADRGGGVARFLTSDPSEEDITTALDEVLAEWSEPVLSGVRLEVNQPGLQAAGRAAADSSQAGWSAVDLGDLCAGRPAWVAGRIARPQGDQLIVRLSDARGMELASCKLSREELAAEHPALKALFGARQVLGLEHLIQASYNSSDLQDQLRRLGYDPQEVLSGGAAPQRVYAENRRQDAQAGLRDLLVREALTFGLASAETAFVAVRSEAGKPIEGTISVANALPSGWSPEFLGAPPAGVWSRAIASAPRPSSPPMPPGVLPAAAHPAAASPKKGGGLLRRIGGLFESESQPRLAEFADRAMDPADPQPQASYPVNAPAAAGAGQPPRVTGPTRPALFSGTPAWDGDSALLFDSSQPGSQLPDQATITKLHLRFAGPAPEVLDPGLSLLIFVGDLVEPRARVRLADLVRLGGERPVNLRKQPGEVLRIVLADPAGAWATGAPALELMLDWT